MSTIACIFAHPDDEAFGPGGTIATLARSHSVYIVCATPGDAQNGPAGLGEIRSLELQKSAKILGVREVIFLNFHDGNLCNNNYHALAKAIQKRLDKLRPDTLLTFEPQGVSGHIDHIVVTMVTSYLFERLAYTKKLMYFCHTVEQVKIIRKIVLDYFIYFPPGYPKDDIGKTIDTSPVWDIRKRAIQQHVSQKDDIEFIMKIHEKLPREEHFLVWEKATV